ncbi:MAG: NAD-dependent epimerase/dehydratase family protein [Cyclobacteriaceae bacterium]
MDKKSVLIVGATGLVGRQVLDVILKNDYYEEILLIGRRSVGVKDNRIKELIIDFEKFEEYKDQISANDYYCCIGSTLKQAGSKDNFKKIDFSYPLMLAQHAKEDPKFEQFLMVSSYGANANSALFYNEIKGITEDALQQVGLKRLLIFQPSLLLGYRKDFRPFEEAAKLVSSVLSFFIIGTRMRFWAIKGSEVALAMFILAKRNLEEGTHVFKPLQMIRLCKSLGHK